MENDFGNLFSVAGKVALVTGGSRGIGEMIAAGLLANGAKVFISSRKAEICDATAKRLSERYGCSCISLPADLSSLAGIESLGERIGQREERLDILVNNAGAAWGAKLETFPEAGWDKVMDTNVKGVFFLTQKVLALLRKAASPENPARIINIGSVDGLKASKFENFSYGVSKAALHHLTRIMATHLTREDILVNAIAPGPFPTWMLSAGLGFGGSTEEPVWKDIASQNPSRRVGAPADIAGLTIFLSSRAGQYVVGQTIACDGGLVVAA